MPKINTCNRGPHEAKTIKRLYQKMVGNLRAQVTAHPIVEFAFSLNIGRHALVFWLGWF